MSNDSIITTRAAQDGDKAACEWIEAGAIKGLHYAMDVWEMFTRGGDGELTVALCGGTPGGMGKLTRLYGGYAWLELLRVHPDFQRRGLGKAIYRRYMEQMAEMGLNAAGMYTGASNKASRGLAELFGLSLRQEFCEHFAAPGPAADAGGFERVPAHMAEQIAAPFYGDMGDFLVINRTFIPVKPGFGEFCGKMGWLYSRGGDIAVAGFRFQPARAVHLAYFSGDAALAKSLASFLARENKSAALSANRRTADSKSVEALERAGFERQPTALITLWSGL